MKVSDPEATWDDLFGYLKTTDQHPPLHFILLRYCFSWFGHTSHVLRIVSVIGGVWGIWGMFVLGREMWDKRLGQTAALLTAVNYYLIFYSQEGRNYIFVFLLSIYSFLYLIRLFRHLTIKNTLLYTLFNVLLLYTHYFGMFLLVGQFIIGVVFFFAEEPERKVRFLKYFTISALLTLGAYSFWISYLIYVNNIGSFWIPKLSPTLLSDYFYEFFGNGTLINFLIVIFLLYYVIRVFSHQSSKEKLLKQPFAAMFVILFLWVFGTLFAPFVRSYVLLPMLISRYVICVLPAIIIAVAWGLSLINNRPVQVLAIATFTVFSLTDLIVVKDYYKTVNYKSDYRGVTNYVMEHNQDGYPIVSSYGWQFSYYFKAKKRKANFIQRKTMHGVDSLVSLAGTPAMLKGFWVVDGHSEDRLMNDNEKVKLNQYYILASRKYYFNAWAELYLAKPDSNTIVMDSTWFKLDGWEYSDVPLWSSDPVVSRSIAVPKGSYRVTVFAQGQQALEEFAKVRVIMDGKEKGVITTSDNQEAHLYDLEVPEDKGIVFDFRVINDLYDEKKNEDRNATIKSIWIQKK